MLITSRACCEKNNSWSVEEETRIVAILRSGLEGEAKLLDYSYIDFPLDFNNFPLSVVLNPWATPEFEASVRSLFLEVKLSQDSIIRSCFQGTSRNRESDN